MLLSVESSGMEKRFNSALGWKGITLFVMFVVRGRHLSSSLQSAGNLCHWAIARKANADRLSHIVFCRVKLEGHETRTLRIQGTVVEGRLELLSFSGQDAEVGEADPDAEDLPTVRQVTFGTVHYGTDRTEAALLYNNSPESVRFVAVLDEDAPGQELVGCL